MKIAIVGCGALGSYYGACLARGGAQVHFLLRSDFEIVRQSGVQILSAAGDFTLHPHAAADPRDIGPCDWVVIGLKTTANHTFAQLLPPLVGPHTALLTLQNGLGNEEALEALFPHNPILGGLCFVCVNRIAPGVIRHMAHGRILLGAWNASARTRTSLIAEAFQRGGVPCDVSDDIADAHWRKLVWNIPFNGLSVASAAGIHALESGTVDPNAPLQPCLSTDRLLADPAWVSWIRRLMSEVIATANALGSTIPDAYADDNIARTFEMGAYHPSTAIDFMEGRPLELESLFTGPAARAQACGVPTPALDRLCAVLSGLARR